MQYFNYAYQRTGTLWKGRYRATVVDSECYLLTCTRYIELDPLRARMVEYPVEYSWSSHHANARGAPDNLLRLTNSISGWVSHSRNGSGPIGSFSVLSFRERTLRRPLLSTYRPTSTRPAPGRPVQMGSPIHPRVQQLMARPTTLLLPSTSGKCPLMVMPFWA